MISTFSADILTTRRGSLEAQRLWTVQECANVFSDSLKDLKEQYKQRGELAWDKVRSK